MDSFFCVNNKLLRREQRRIQPQVIQGGFLSRKPDDLITP